jgi:hypothetical protein
MAPALRLLLLSLAPLQRCCFLQPPTCSCFLPFVAFASSSGPIMVVTTASGRHGSSRLTRDLPSAVTPCHSSSSSSTVMQQHNTQDSRASTCAMQK